ncbi:MAG: SDR family NAD(P)-dependent oxidoreductase [Thalassobaculales bacterium]
MRFKTIVVTGATSGIGRALALHWARPGVNLLLAGRDGGRLVAVGQACREKGASVAGACLDVTDAEATAEWLLRVDDDWPVDLVVANAGISAGTAGGAEEAGQVRALFATNVDGVLNTVLPLLPRMRARGHGQVALMASLAGYRGIPGAPAYCASKAAVKVWGEGLRGQLRADGIGVTVVCPGYVRTAMTAANDFPMPFLMDAGRAAAIIAAGIEANRARVAFPWPMAAAVWLLQALPPAWTDRLLARLPRKGAAPAAA